MALQFLSFWIFRSQLLGSPPQVAKNGPFAQRPYNGFISAVTGSILQFLALWAFISLHFRLVGLHFLAFWPCGPSFPCILALWAFISLHFGRVGLHFLAIWPFWSQLPGPPPHVTKNGPFAQRPYNGFISVVTGSILQFLAFWAFISLHFGLVGLHFLAFLALWAFISLHFGLVGLHFLAIWLFRSQLLAPPPPPTSCEKWPVCPTSLQWIYQRRDRLHFAVFSLVGLHFLAFWRCGPSFPCILDLWAFISLQFGLFGVSFQGPPTCCQKLPVCPTSLQWIYQRRDRLHFAVFSILGLHFLAFWPCGPSFPCILALWAFIPCNFLGLQLQRNRQRADPGRCPISMCPPLDRGARGVDNPKTVKVKMRVERQRGWDLTASARARRLRPLGRGAPLPVDTLNPKP